MSSLEREIGDDGNFSFIHFWTSTEKECTAEKYMVSGFNTIFSKCAVIVFNVNNSLDG